LSSDYRQNFGKPDIAHKTTTIKNPRIANPRHSGKVSGNLSFDHANIINPIKKNNYKSRLTN
jgi:hypothetical protein